MFPKKIYDRVKEYKFESIKLIGPEDYDYYLKQLYNDYNKVPNENERNPHSTKVVN